MMSTAFAAECGDPAADLASAEQLVLYADLDGGRAALERLESTLGCGPPADPGLLGRMWLVEGGLLIDSGDRVSGATSFAAARRVAPTIWIDGLGPEKRKAYDAVGVPGGQGQITVDVQDGVSGTAWIDGAVQYDPIVVAPGEHLVQYGAEGRVWFAKLVVVSEDETLHVAASAPASSIPEVQSVSTRSVTPPANEVVVHTIPPESFTRPEEPPPAHTQAYPHLAVGTDLAFGGSLGDVLHASSTDPTTVVLLPIEIGGGAEGKHGWVRAAASVAPLLSGDLQYTSTTGTHGTGFGAGGHVAGGASFGPLDVGLLGGVAWPGRVLTRFVVGFTIPGAPIEIEARVGANVLAGGALEPAATFVLAFPGTGGR